MCEAFGDRKVVVEVHGEQLRGRYALWGTKACSRDVAELIAGRTSGWRTGKVLVDWGQNDRHESAVAAYSRALV